MQAPSAKSLFKFSLLLLTSLLLVPGSIAGASDEAAQTQKELKQVQARISTLKSKIERDQRRRGDLNQALGDAEKEIANQAARLHTSENAIANYRQKIGTLDKQSDNQKQALEGRLGALSTQIRTAYRTGQQGKLRLLFSQNNPATLGRLLKYHDYYASAQTAAIASVREDLNALRTTRTELASARDALETQRQTQSQLIAGLRDSQRKRERALTVVDKALAGGGHKLDTLKADESQLRDLLDAVRNRLADIPVQNKEQPFIKGKGRLSPPVSGRVIASFGQKKSGGPLRWQGMWIAAKAGAPVSTAAAGRVAYVGQMHRYGLIIVLDHGDDFFTVYGHIQAAYVEVGQSVRTEQTIAAAGNSGGHKVSGVYFEIRQGRKAVDPAAWFNS